MPNQKVNGSNEKAKPLTLDISLGSTKSSSKAESITHESVGSHLSASGSTQISSKDDTTIRGSTISAKDILVDAGKDINIFSAENTSQIKEKAHGSSGSIGASLGIHGIKASYSKEKDDIQENEITHTVSEIKTENSAALSSGKNTFVKGGKVSGSKVIINAGRNFSIESEQDSHAYHEKGKNTGISFERLSGITGGIAEFGNKDIDSTYESVIEQSGIRAGGEGFRITVGNNTNLKGSIIDSKAPTEKNGLTTGTLTWGNIDNRAGYESGGKGFSYGRGTGLPLNTRGLLSDLAPTVKDSKGTTTRSAISDGTITITNKERQKQDIGKLNRDTLHSLNHLKDIFDKKNVEEKQELIQMMNVAGNEAIHEVSDHYGWKEGSNEKILLHGALGALTGTLSKGGTWSGALSGSVNEFAVGYIERTKGREWMEKHPDTVQAVSTALGAAVGEFTGNSSIGAYTAQMGTEWNTYGKETKENIEQEKEEAKGDDKRLKKIDEELYMVDALDNAMRDSKSEKEKTTPLVNERTVQHNNHPVYTLPTLEIYTCRQTPEYIKRSAQVIALKIKPGMQISVNGSFYNVDQNLQMIPVKNPNYNYAWKVNIQEGTLTKYQSKKKEEESFNVPDSVSMAFISEALGDPWAELNKHGTRGIVGFIGKYNVVGSAVGGVIDVTGDVNTYSGRDLAIAVGLDFAKMGFGMVAGVIVPVPEIIYSPFLDLGSYHLKKVFLKTDRQKDKGEN